MEYSVQKVLSLISHIHSVSAEFTNRRLAEKNLISSHGFILFQLAQNETMSMTQLAACINRDKSTTTVLVKKLLAEDLVKITTSSEDSRVRLISLTSKGKKYKDLDNNEHQYLIDISSIEGSVKIVFNGGYIDNTGNSESQFEFSKIALY